MAGMAGRWVWMKQSKHRSVTKPCGLEAQIQNQHSPAKVRQTLGSASCPAGTSQVMQDRPVKVAVSTSVEEGFGVYKVFEQPCSCKTHHKQADKAVEPNRCKHMQTSMHNVSGSW